MNIKIDLRKILQDAQNNARSGIPMDEAISMAVWEAYPQTSDTAMAMVSTALLEFDSGQAGTLEETVQNMLRAIETSAHPGVLTGETDSEPGVLTHQTASPVRLESGNVKLILILLAVAALIYRFF